jgi:hypothetical protein
MCRWQPFWKFDFNFGSLLLGVIFGEKFGHDLYPIFTFIDFFIFGVKGPFYVFVGC